MQAIREYLLSVTAAAILCGIATSLLGKKGMIGTTIQLLAGVFMILTVVGPFVNIRFERMLNFSDVLADEADMYVASGEKSARETMSEIIKAQAEAYILDKAETLGVQLSVEVTLSQEQIPVPVSVNLSGNVSPYARQVISEMIEENLGIGTEDQIWTSQG